LILSLETSTHICSVALGTDRENVKELRTEQRGTHSEKLFQFIRQLLDETEIKIKDLDALITSAGPGSFTGLRIAASGIKGLLYNQNVSFYEVDTLAGFAASVVSMEPPSTCRNIHSVLDARRNHLYYRAFRISDGCLIAQNDPEILPLNDITGLIKTGDCITGTGIDRLDADHIPEIYRLDQSHISAKNLIEIYRMAIIKNQKGWQSYIQSGSPDIFEPRYVGGSQVNTS